MSSFSSASPGVVESVFNRLVLRRARVRAVERLGATFRLVTLAGKDFEDRNWTPGDMLQIGFPGLAGRAYTPTSFDPSAGSMTLLGYVHGQGVASDWFSSARVGEEIFAFGPRGALDLDRPRRPLFFFGDETSFGTAAALSATADEMRGVRFAFEVASGEASHVALERVGVTRGVLLVEREEGDRHLEAVEEDLVRLLRAEPEAACVFTGKASSIQRLYKAARRAGASAKRIKNLLLGARSKRVLRGPALTRRERSCQAGASAFMADWRSASENGFFKMRAYPACSISRRLG